MNQVRISQQSYIFLEFLKMLREVIPPLQLKITIPCFRENRDNMIFQYCILNTFVKIKTDVKII